MRNRERQNQKYFTWLSGDLTPAGLLSTRAATRIKTEKEMGEGKRISILFL